jgi:O-antigen/teichoic acid export membrane protein
LAKSNSYSDLRSDDQADLSTAGLNTAVPFKETSLSKPLGIYANFSWGFLGNCVYAACQLAILTVLAKLGKPETVGQFSLALAVAAPVFMLTNLQLSAVQSTDCRRDFQFGHYLGLRLICSTFAFTIICALASRYRAEAAIIIVIVGLAKTFESISDVTWGTMQLHKRMDRLAISMFLKGPLSLAALATGLLLGGSLLWSVIGLLCVWALLLPLVDAQNVRHVLQSESSSTERSMWPRWQRKKLTDLAWLSLPLGLVMLLNSLNYNIPRLLIERHLGERELGIFAAVSCFMIAGNVVIQAMANSANPVLAAHWTANDTRAFVRLLTKQLLLAALLGAGGVLLTIVGGKTLLTLLYRSEYAESSSLLVTLMCAGGIEYIAVILDYALISARSLRPQLFLSILVTGTIAIGSHVLLPTKGLQGVAQALVIAAAIHLIGGITLIAFAVRKHSVAPSI